MDNRMLPRLEECAKALVAEESDEIITWEDGNKEPTSEMLDKASARMICELEAFWTVLRGTNRGLSPATERALVTVLAICVQTPGNDAPIRVDLAALGDGCDWDHFLGFIGLHGDMGSAYTVDRELSILAAEAQGEGLVYAAALLGMLTSQVHALKAEHPAHERAEEAAEKENLQELAEREDAVEASSI